MEIINTQYSKFDIPLAPIQKLRRCTKCVLPETMPFIEFDHAGVCNYCRSYKKREYAGEEAVRQMAETLRKPAGQYDSLVSFSGGRDSCYGLHYFVKELGLTPLAYCYDWGMGTDIAARNQKRLCNKLNIKLVTVRADIEKKRTNIRKNVTAWLKRPALGIIPLFMAGDKHYFYHAYRICKENKLNTILMASNPFEETHFKSGFCGVKPAILRTGEHSDIIEKLPMNSVLQMSGFYLREFLCNPSYINTSIWDTFTAAFTYYIIPHKDFRLFNYIPWNEETVDNTLAAEYDWERSPDAASTWRIGDGTAPFYNYVYYRVAGFTENDTLRSNQIREGMITREQALEYVYRDNAPRYASMKWYFDTIGMDMESVLRRVNEIKPLYPIE